MCYHRSREGVVRSIPCAVVARCARRPRCRRPEGGGARTRAEDCRFGRLGPVGLDRVAQSLVPSASAKRSLSSQVSAASTCRRQTSAPATSESPARKQEGPPTEVGGPSESECDAQLSVKDWSPPSVVPALFVATTL